MSEDAPADPQQWWSHAADGNVEEIRKLLKQHPMLIDEPSPAEAHSRRTAVMLAARNGHRSVIECLVESNADLDAQDRFGVTALNLACFWNRVKVVKLLLNAGADPTIEEGLEGASPGKTPLMAALEKDNDLIIEMLLEHNRKLGQHTRTHIKEKDDACVTPLDYAKPLGTLKLLHYGFHGTLLHGVERALLAANELSIHEREGVEELHRDQHRATHAQVVATGLLKMRSDGWTQLSQDEGIELVQKAVDMECKVFVGHPEVQKRMRRLWHGEFFAYLLWYQSHGREHEYKRSMLMQRWLLFVTFIPLNLLLLPIIAVCPPLDEYLSRGIHSSTPLEKQFKTSDPITYGDLCASPRG